MPDTGSRWQRQAFGDFVENVAERVDDPSAAGVDRYVGLEHLDPGSLHIRRWGSPSDVGATKLRFMAGDVIFGRRRAYQRKVAQADFEGICSAHAMVLRARPDCILPELLPFFIQSEPFLQRAIAISVGSLSPTVNWGALAQEEFSIPPLGEQERIAALLWAASRDVIAAEDAQAAAEALHDAVCADHFERQLDEAPVGRLRDGLSQAQYGISAKAAPDGEVPIVGMAQMVDGRMVTEGAGFVTLPAKELEAYYLQTEDILFNRTNSFEHVGRVAFNELEEKVVFASYLVRLRVDSKVTHPRYLFEYLASAPGQQRLRRFITRGVSQANINATNLKSIEMPFPPLDSQQEFLARIEELDALIATLRERHQAAQRMTMALIDERLDPVS